MKTIIIFFLISLSFFQPTCGKEIEPNPTAIFLELGGQGLLLSLNADYKFSKQFSIRGGFSYLLLGYGFPFSFNYISNPKSSYHFEAGIGFIFGSTSSFNFLGYSGGGKEFFFLTSNIGLRYQPQKDGFFFRLTFNPLFNFKSSEYIDEGRSGTVSKTELEFKPWFGLSIGYSFVKK